MVKNLPADAADLVRSWSRKSHGSQPPRLSSRARAPQREKPPREACAPQRESPRSQQLDTAISNKTILKTAFTPLGHFHFHTISLISLSVSTNTAQFLLELHWIYRCMCDDDIFTKKCFLIHWYSKSLHIEGSLIYFNQVLHFSVWRPCTLFSRLTVSHFIFVMLQVSY